MPEADRSPWENELRDAIAEEIASSAERDMGVKNLKEPTRGLLDIFDCLPATREQGRLRLVRKLNHDPLNAAAKRWLPPSWGDDNTLHVLSLMLWGACEASTVPDYWETPDVVGELVADMMKWNPAYVMAMLQNPENPEAAHEEVSLTADKLSARDNAGGAAWLLMEQLEIAIKNRNDILPSDEALPSDESNKSGTSTRVQDAIVAEVADLAARRIVGSTIAWLKAQKAELSGDDTPLKNVWEEVCVQVHGDESVLWEVYKDTIMTDLTAKIEQLKRYKQVALWLQTDQGSKWRFDQEYEGSSSDESPPVVIDDIAEYLWAQYIWQRADTYSNSRTREWLAR